MRIHNTEIDPTTITRLTIEHAHGMIDLSGDVARAAMAQIRRVKVDRPARGYTRPTIPDGYISPTAVRILRALVAGPLTVEAASIATGLSLAAAGRVLAGLGDRVVRTGGGRRGDPFVYALAPSSSPVA